MTSCLCSPECRAQALRDAAPDLADALESCYRRIRTINDAHDPGTQIPGWEGAMMDLLKAESALRKAGRLP